MNKVLAKIALLCVCPLLVAVTVTSSADITGDAAAHAVGTGLARWVQVDAVTGNSADVRVGGSNTSSTIGKRIAAGGSQFFPPIAPNGYESTSDNSYDLSSMFYYAATNDKVTITWAK